MVADALSRYPMLGPKTLSLVGNEGALKSLLSVLKPALAMVDTKRFWFWAGNDTSVLKSEVRSNIDLKKLYTSSPRDMFKPTAHWSASVLMPRSDRATAVAAHVLRDPRPSAVLTSSDLVHYVPQQTDLWIRRLLRPSRGPPKWSS